MDIPAICNGCGNESPAWDQLCENCSKEIICQSCNRKYKRGQGLQNLDLCPSCVREFLESPEEEQRTNLDPDELGDPYADYGFDHQWELYEK